MSGLFHRNFLSHFRQKGAKLTQMDKPDGQKIQVTSEEEKNVTILCRSRQNFGQNT
jgi:hypothetical protein